MPYKMYRKPNGKYMVENELTEKVHAKNTTKKKAMGQLHLLNAIDHGFVPLHKYHSTVVPKGKKKVLEK